MKFCRKLITFNGLRLDKTYTNRLDRSSSRDLAGWRSIHPSVYLTVNSSSARSKSEPSVQVKRAIFLQSIGFEFLNDTAPARPFFLFSLPLCRLECITRKILSGELSFCDTNARTNALKRREDRRSWYRLCDKLGENFYPERAAGFPLGALSF